jgi:hypothetical protein
LVVVDGLTYSLPEPVNWATIHLLLDLLKWSAHYSDDGRTVELHNPRCLGGCGTLAEGGVTIVGS